MLGAHLESVAARYELPTALPAPQILGTSRAGLEMRGWKLGSGPLHVSLIGGCHADEPVGPMMLHRLVAWLADLPDSDPLLAAASWWIVPHANPDGAVINGAWSHETVASMDHLGTPDRTFDLATYLRNVVRELPGDDIEFGFPRSADDREARPENLAVASFLAAGAPFHLHGSFHGMSFARFIEWELAALVISAPLVVGVG